MTYHIDPEGVILFRLFAAVSGLEVDDHSLGINTHHQLLLRSFVAPSFLHRGRYKQNDLDPNTDNYGPNIQL